MNNQLSLFDIDFESSIENNEVEESYKMDTSGLKYDFKIPAYKKSEKKQFIINEKVILKYKGILYDGMVKSIYNNGYTINCIFDGGRKHSAFYVDNVIKLV